MKAVSVGDISGLMATPPKVGYGGDTPDNVTLRCRKCRHLPKTPFRWSTMNGSAVLGGVRFTTNAGLLSLD